MFHLETNAFFLTNQAAKMCHKSIFKLDLKKKNNIDLIFTDWPIIYQTEIHKFSSDLLSRQAKLQFACKELAIKHDFFGLCQILRR